MQAIDFLLQLAIILTATKVFGIIMRKFGLPQVLGFILAGILIGPAIWSLIFDLNPIGVFPIHESSYLKAFAEVGVVFVMFTAGLETNLKQIKETGLVAFAIAFCGVIVPLAGGFGVAWLFLPDAGVFTWLFVGVIMTATSVGITVEVLRELGKLQTKVGTIILSAAIIDDILGIIVLAIVLSLSGGISVSPVLSTINPNNNALISIAWILAFFVFAIGFGVVAAKAFKWLEKRNPHTRRIPILSIALCLTYAYVSEQVFGVADITGAFMAGLVLSVNHSSAEYVDRRVTISSYIMFAPIFFASIGIKMSFSGFSFDILWFAIAFVIVAILTKIIGCGLSAKAFKFSLKDSARIAIGMIARGEVALIVMEKGVSGGLIDSKYRAIVVLLVLVSLLVAPIVLKLLFRKEEKQVLPTRQELEEGHFE